MSQRMINLLIAVIAAIFLLNASAFVVDERKAAIVFQFGRVERVIDKPGLHWKVPFVQDVRLFDLRIQTMDSAESAPFNTLDKQNVLIDSYVKWRITDVRRFYLAFGSASQQDRAQSRLQQSINNIIYAEIGKRLQSEVISTRREEMMATVLRRVNDEVARMGVRVVDVRLKRISYSQAVSDSVFDRMSAERARVANELRSTGAATNISIKADADKESSAILAAAYEKAQAIKGRADAQAAQTYAQAYSANPEFYRFYRSLEAYRESFKSRNDVLVLQPDSEFFKYMRQPGSK